MSEFQPPNGSKPTGTDANDPAKIAQIEADIDQTRSAITGDLRTLGARLSPENLKQEAKEVMHEAKNMATEALHEAKNVATSTYREVKDDAIETVSAKVDEFRDGVRGVEQEAIGFLRDNAVPLALIGIGAAWLYSSRRSSNERWEGQYRPRGSGEWRYPPRGDSRYNFDHPHDASRGRLGRAVDTTRDLGQQARDKARDWVEGAGHEVQNAGSQVRQFAEREYDQVKSAAHDAQEQLGRATSRARDVAGRELRHARDVSRQTLDSHPLAVAAAAVAAGVTVGLLIPETQREDELFGAQRERLVGEAKQAVREAKGAALDLTSTAKETARDVKSTLSGNP